MKRKSLSEQDIEAAHRLKEIWNSRKTELGLTQDRAAEILGFATQGAVSHYLNAKTPLNLEAVLKFANLLQVAPESIRPDFSDLLNIARLLTPSATQESIPPEQKNQTEEPVTGSMANMAFRIATILEETKWSQAELGRRVGVSQQTVQRWAAGQVSPNPENLDKLSEVTGHPPYWFMLPPDKSDQVVTPESMKIGPKQLELLRTFDAFPEEDQDKKLQELKDEKEKKEQEAARWFRAQKGRSA